MSNLRTGPPGPVLWRLAWPTALGIGLVYAVDLVDLRAAGQLGVADVAALGLLGPLLIGATALASGLGNAVTVATAAALGEDRRDEARSILSTAVVGAGVLAAVLALVGWTVGAQVLARAELEPALHSGVETWLAVWWWGLPALVTALVGAGGLRGVGDTRSAAVVLLVVAVVNGVLTPVLALGLDLGLAGVALSTVLARSAGLLGTLARLRSHGMWVGPRGWRSSALRPTALLAGPMVATKLAWPVALGLVTGLVAKHGTTVVAAFALATRVEALVMVPIAAVSSALGPMVAQSRGDRERLTALWRLARRFALVWGGTMWLLLAIASSTVLSLWSGDPRVVHWASLQLLVGGAGWWAHGWVSHGGATLAALGHPQAATTLVALRGFGLAVPLAWLLGAGFGPGGLYAALGIASVTVGLAARRAVGSRLGATSTAAADGKA